MPQLAIGPAMLISGLIGGGASIAGSALSGKQKTQTQTSTSTPTYSPEMQALQKRLLDYSGGMMSNPSAGLEPMKTASSDRINRRYSAMPGKISQNMASRGYGSSGSFGNTMYQSEQARSGEMSDLDSLMTQLALGRQDQGATIGQNLLRMGQGTTSTGTGTQPGNMAANGLMSAGNGMENIATLLMMNKILKGDSGSMNVSGGGGMS